MGVRVEIENDEKRIRMMYSKMPEGVMYCSIVYDDNTGAPVDVYCNIVNKAFEISTGQGPGHYKATILQMSKT